MTRDEFISMLKNELEELENAAFEDEERDCEVEGFYEAYTQPSAAACSNILYAASDEFIDGSDEKRTFERVGTNLMITVLHEENGFDSSTYIVSLVNMETLKDEKRLFKDPKDVVEYAVEEWFNIYYNKERRYEWYYKDGEYSEVIIND